MKTFISLIKLSVHSKEAKDKIASFALIALALEILAISGSFGLNHIYGNLYDAIQNYRTSLIWLHISQFGLIAMGLVLVNGYLGFYANKLSFALREGLTSYFLEKASGNQRALSLVEQRVQEDFKRFGEQSVELFFALFKSAANLVLFTSVIVSLTQWWIGLLVVTATLGGTWLTKKVGRPLVSAQSTQESLEAGFRIGLTKNNFSKIQDQFQIINSLFKKLSFTQSGLSQAFVLLPFILLMPLYISKALTMGSFMQSVNALNKVIDSLSVLIDNRQTLVNIQTCLSRLKFLVDSHPNP